jgi:hypothetical protein
MRLDLQQDNSSSLFDADLQAASMNSSHTVQVCSVVCLCLVSKPYKLVG